MKRRFLAGILALVFILTELQPVFALEGESATPTDVTEAVQEETAATATELPAETAEEEVPGQNEVLFDTVPVDADQTYSGQVLIAVNNNLGSETLTSGKFTTADVNSVPEADVRLWEQDDVPCGTPYTDPVTGETYIRRDFSPLPSPTLPEPKGILRAQRETQINASYSAGSTKRVYGAADNAYMNMECLYVGRHCTVWGDTGSVAALQLNAAKAKQIAGSFDDKFEAMSAAFGSYWYDVDGDKKIALFCYDIEHNYKKSFSTYTCGFFNWPDMANSSGYVNGVYKGSTNNNTIDCLHIDTYPTMGFSTLLGDVENCFGTLVHEFQHMINFSYSVSGGSGKDFPVMETYLNEAFSMGAEQLIFGPEEVRSRITFFNNPSSYLPGNPLTYWVQNDLSNYANSYLFGQYLRTRWAQQTGSGSGNDFYMEVFSRRNAGNANDTLQIIADMLNTTKNDLVTDFWAAVYLKNAAGPYGFRGESWAEEISPLFSTAVSTTGIYNGGAKFYHPGDGITVSSGNNITFVTIDGQGNVETSGPPSVTYLNTERITATSAKVTMTFRGSGALRYCVADADFVLSRSDLDMGPISVTSGKNLEIVLEDVGKPEEEKVFYYMLQGTDASSPGIDSVTIPAWVYPLTLAAEHGTVTAKSGDTVYASGDLVRPGTRISITAKQEEGYYLSEILLDGEAMMGDSFVTTGAHKVRAVFKKVDVPAAKSFGGGSGTAADPYTVGSVAELKYFANRVNGGDPMTGKYVALTGDIDMLDMVYTPIGKDAGTPFGGTFDGGGYRIRDLAITEVSGTYLGLFGMISSGGTVKDVRLEALDVTCGTDLSGAAVYLGGIAGRNDGTVSGCRPAGKMTVSGGDTVYAGGIAGTNAGTVENCDNGSVEIRLEEGRVSTVSAYVGGVVGNNAACGVVRSTESTGDLRINDPAAASVCRVGGIAGGNAGLIENCKVNAVSAGGSVGGDMYYGGAVGYLSGGTVASCVVRSVGAFSRAADGSVGAVGGIAGYAKGGTVRNCYASSPDLCILTYASYVAGHPILGGASTTPTVSNCYYYASTMGSRCTSNGYGTPIYSTGEDFFRTTLGLDMTDLWEYGVRNDGSQPTLRSARRYYAKRITVAPCQHGTVSVDMPLAYVGQQVTLSSVAEDGYGISYYTVDGERIEGSTFTVTADHTVSAVFDVAYTATLGPCEHGNVTISTSADNLHIGDVVTITATPDSGYVPYAFYVNGKPLTYRYFTVEENCTVTAEFRQGSYYGDYNDHVSYSLLKDGTLLVYGDGAMPAANGAKSWNYKWDMFHLSVKKVTVREGVTGIGYGAFLNGSNIKEVSLPDTLTTIGDRAFYGCTVVLRMTLPGSITAVGSDAFNGCLVLGHVYCVGSADDGAALQQRLTDAGGNSAAVAAKWHYAASRDQIVALTPEQAEGGTVSGLKNAAYGLDDALYVCGETVELQQETNIGYLFRTFLVNGEPIEGNTFTVTGGGTVSAAFTKICDAVKGGACGDNAYWALTAEGALHVYGSGAMENHAAGTAPWYGDRGGITEVKIHAGVTAVGEYAFAGCTALKAVDLPEGLITVGSYAFSDCTALEEVTLPDGTETVGEGAFGGCALKAVDLPGSLITVGSYAFAGCTALEEVTLRDGTETVGEGAFAGCVKLSGVVLPEGITALGDLAFSGCAALEAIILPENVTALGEKVFENCAALRWMILWGEKIASVETAAFSGCTALCDVYCIGESDGLKQKLTAAGGSESILSARWYCVASAEQIVVPTVPINWCGKVSTEMRPYVLGETVKLHQLASPGYVFETFLVNGEPIEGDSFTVSTAHCEISARFSPVEDLREDYYGYCCGYCGEELLWALKTDGTLLIYGVGEMTDYSDSSGSRAPWYRYSNGSFNYLMKKVEIAPGVTGVGNYAFQNCWYTLVSISLPASITHCGKNAFSGCSSLEKIYITDLAAWCSIDFENNYSNPLCNAATLYLNGEEVRDLEIPGNVTAIGDYAFYGWYALQSVTIPAGVTSIGAYAFYGCSGLQELTLPASVTGIGTYAFYGCSGLRELNLPADMTSIGTYAFSRCSGLRAVTVPAGVTALASGTFSSCSHLEQVTLPEGLKTIGEKAFSSCTALEVITIPTGVTAIGNYAFSGCEKLRAVTVPQGVKRLGLYIFSDCTSLIDVTIPTGVTSIGTYAFSGCSGLQELTLPADVTSIGAHAFTGCSGLTDVFYITPAGNRQAITMGAGNQALLDAAWHYTAEGVLSVTVAPVQYGTVITGRHKYTAGDTVTLHYVPQPGYDLAYYTVNGERIEGSTFTVSENCAVSAVMTKICDAVKGGSCGSSVFWALTAEGTLHVYGSGAMENYIAGKVPWSDDGESVTEAVIHAGVTQIGDNAFYAAHSLKKVTFADGVTSIGDHAFAYCRGLKEITLPAGVGTIGDYAFYDCSKLEEVVFPQSLTAIGTYAFRYCTGLKNVYYISPVQNHDAITIGSNNEYLLNAAWHYPAAPEDIVEVTISQPQSGTVRLDGTRYARNETVTVFCEPPAGYAPDRFTVNGEPIDGNTFTVTGNCTVSVTFAKFCDAVSGGACGDTVYWALTAEGTLHVYGSGAMTAATVDWEEKDSVRKVVVHPGVTGIADNAFSYCSGLTEVTLPAGMTAIGRYAFDECTSLTEITLPDSVTAIGDSAFSYCRALEKITFSKDLTTIGQWAFSNCSALKELIFPAGLTSIGRYAFRYCTGLKNVYYISPVQNYYAISIGYDNDELLDAAWHYPAAPEDIVTVTVSQPTGGTVSLSSGRYAKNERITVSCRPDPGYLPAYLTVNGERVEGETVTVPGECTVSAVFTKICDAVSGGSCGDKVYWAKPLGNVLHIYGTGPMKNYGDSYEVPYNRAAFQIAEIHEGVTSVGGYAFYGAKNLRKITFADSVTSIGDYAFEYCDKLTAITLPAGLRTIGKAMFYDCDGLTDITIPAGVTSIGDYAFYDCSELAEVVFPQSLTSIGDYAFEDCDKLTAITLPAGLRTIGKAMFYDCDGLTDITIPAGVTSIGDYAFNSCDALTAVLLPGSLTKVGARAFGGCRALKDVYYVSSVQNHDDISVGDYNDELLDAVWHYVASAEDVVEVTVSQPEKGEINPRRRHYAINEQATLSCIPEPGYAVEYYTVNGEPIEGSTFTVTGNCTVSAVMTKLCDAVSGGVCGDNAYWAMTAEAVLHIYGTGPVSCKSSRSYPWGNDISSIREVVIHEGITQIGDYAFYNAPSLKKVTFADSVTSIGVYAFRSCSDLKEITLSAGLTSIGNDAFAYCGVEEVTFPAGVTTIGSDAFFYCGKLTKVVFSAPVTAIGSSAFGICPQLADLWYPGDAAAWTAVGGDSAYSYKPTLHLCRRGDLNGTGDVSVTDLECLFTYLSVGKREGQITDEAYFLAVADVNGDGDINILDYQSLYEQVKKAPHGSGSIDIEPSRTGASGI